MRFALVLSIGALAVSAQDDPGQPAQPCAETTVTGSPITAFAFNDDGDGFWRWLSTDVSSVNLRQDCILRTPDTQVRAVCIQPSTGADKCFSLNADLYVDGCSVPTEYCQGVKNMWGYK
ncbi:hypothetical protein CGRA01v4_12240 [Colletotrichum graminicola]|nr:hypothetical protein CGRA01v4_12240 [Colletotrichum graminicola]